MNIVSFYVHALSTSYKGLGSCNIVFKKLVAINMQWVVNVTINQVTVVAFCFLAVKSVNTTS